MTTAPWTTAEHRSPLPGGSWELWRWLVLRGAGLPAAAVLALAPPGLAARADSLLDLHEAALDRRRAALDRVGRALDELRGDDGDPDSRERRAPLVRALYALWEGKIPRRCPSPDIAAAVADLAAAEDRAAALERELSAACDDAAAATSQEIARVAASPLFREAVTWQTRHAAELPLAEAAQWAAGQPRTPQRRKSEEVVATYLQRYAAKNDTIGFFGPVGWARLAFEGPLVQCQPGPGLIARRSVYFEHWAIAALARRLAEEPALRPWLAPRLRLGVGWAAGELRDVDGRIVPLAPEEERVLAGCDGARRARDIAEELAASPLDPLPPGQVLAVLDRLAQAGIVTWTLEVPLELRPELTLRAALERIGDPDLREPALRALEELDEGRRRVAGAAGDPAALARRLGELDATFTRLTGAAPYRNAGRMYAARSLVYEDCRRDAEVAFGPELLHRLGPPLTLVLQSARWLTSDIARRFEQELAALHAALQDRCGAEAVPSALFVQEARATLLAGDNAGVTAAGEELRDRWARLLGIGPAESAAGAVHRRAADLAERAAEAFGDAGPAWSLVRHFSPDLLLAAPGAAALRRGDFQAVLGELHPGNTLGWSCFLSQHPAPEELLEALAADLGRDPLVMPQIPRYWNQRTNIGLVLPSFHRYEIVEQPPGRPACRPLPAGTVEIVRQAGRLEARSRDGAVRLPAIELFGLYLTDACSTILGQLLPPAPHGPRVAIDDLVIARRRWSFEAAELDFAAVKAAAPRFLAARRWARRHRLPRFSFYKLPSETKPIYLDLDSPIYVDIFARLLRKEGAPAAGPGVVVSEMLPDFRGLWLTDGQGNAFTSELRLTAILGEPG